MTDTVLERLRCATTAELLAIAHALDFNVAEITERLGIDVERDSDVVAVLVADRFVSTCKDWDLKQTLTHVAVAAADSAGWEKPHVDDEVQVPWLEEYVYRALCFASRPDRKAVPKEECVSAEKVARRALQGESESARQLTDQLSEQLGLAISVGVGLAAGWWVLAGIGAVAMLGWLIAPSMKRLVPATMMLIHVRKRLEFEALLQGGSC